jgi:NAD+ kinase
VAIVHRPQSVHAEEKARELAAWLTEQGFKVLSAPGQKLGRGVTALSSTSATSIDWMIVLGGDGTYLQAVRLLSGRQVPLLGVNMGSLGFLTDTRIEDLYRALFLTLQGKMDFRSRAMLQIEVHRTLRGKRRLRSSHLALNDAVIERGSTTHLINIEIHSQKHSVGQIKADALIVASPTGSTAYNLAAGGPILHPEVKAMVVTPVCPHALTNRPLIFPDDQQLSFRNLSADRPAVLTVDGQYCGELTPADEVVIVRNPVDQIVIKRASHNFFQLLREKLKFGERA